MQKGIHSLLENSWLSFVNSKYFESNKQIIEGANYNSFIYWKVSIMTNISQNEKKL